MNQLKLLKAQPYVEAQKIKLKNEITEFKNMGIHPHLHAVIVGENPASLKYLRNKQKMCEELGAEFSLKSFPSHIKTDEFLQHLKSINQNKKIHGCIIQLPVEGEIKKIALSHLISPQKDVDGFHPENIFKLYMGQLDQALISCTPKGILALLQFYGIPIEGQHVVIVGRSNIVGKPLSLLLTHHHATVTLAHSKTKNLKVLFESADIIVGAIGFPEFFNIAHLPSHKNPIVIDVGINTSSSGKLVGDFNQEDVSKICSQYTPVPGGIGPMTVISLLENLLIATKLQQKESP
jgi:methylenetetrahydrofolate dehydrogenase (NADP+)/methenyltetrahydrofolate cyclohydrolase